MRYIVLVLWLLIPLYNYLFFNLSRGRPVAIVPDDIYILAFIYLFLVSNISNIFTKIVLLFWYLFYFFGLTFLNRNIGSHFVIDHLNADIFLFYCLISTTLGVLIFEYIYPVKFYYVKLNIDIGQYFNFIFLLFPFLYFIDFFLVVGFIPMFKGESIVRIMYEIEYGKLYGFKIFISLSTSYVFYKFLESKKLLYIFLLFIYLFISLLDGKRSIFIQSIFSCFVIYFVFYKDLRIFRFKNLSLIILSTFLLLFTYVYVNDVRSNSISEKDYSSVSKFITSLPFGVEYYDFVYSFNLYKPGSIQNYNYIESSVASLFNSFILDIFGYNKLEMVEKGSAYVWKRLYYIEDGIRTGIFSELYFDFGYFNTILISLIIGFIISYINQFIYLFNSLFSILIISVIFSLVALLIVGQSTVFFGSLPPLFYIFILKRVLPLK